MKPIHKYFRRLSDRAQFILCTNVRCDYAEKKVSYFWKNVTCVKCAKLRK